MTPTLLVHRGTLSDTKGSREVYAAATDAEILAQPCVVEALKKAREDALMEAIRDLRAKADQLSDAAEEAGEEWREDAAEEIDHVATVLLLKVYGVSFPDEGKP